MKIMCLKYSGSNIYFPFSVSLFWGTLSNEKWEFSNWECPSKQWKIWILEILGQLVYQYQILYYNMSLFWAYFIEFETVLFYFYIKCLIFWNCNIYNNSGSLNIFIIRTNLFFLKIVQDIFKFLRNKSRNRKVIYRHVFNLSSGGEKRLKRNFILEI